MLVQLCQVKYIVRQHPRLSKYIEHSFISYIVSNLYIFISRHNSKHNLCRLLQHKCWVCSINQICVLYKSCSTLSIGWKRRWWLKFDKHVQRSDPVEFAAAADDDDNDDGGDDNDDDADGVVVVGELRHKSDLVKLASCILHMYMCNKRMKGESTKEDKSTTFKTIPLLPNRFRL